MSGSTQAWRCTVCGYVHRGPEPPVECPVCGSPGDRFEPYSEEVQIKVTAKPPKWRCLVCTFIHKGDDPPAECPVCGTPGQRFEGFIEQEAEAGTDTGKSENIIVIGSGIAGISAVESIRSLSSGARITLLTKEKDLPYYRLNLTRLLAGEIDEDALPIHPESWYRENRVDLLAETDVSSILLEKKEVSLVDGKALRYDKLILTPGAHPFAPPIPGIQKEGVTTLRSLGDARAILQAAKKARSIVIIGGGVLGLETAGALAKISKNIILLETYTWLMPRQLNRRAAERLQKHVETLGVTFKIDVSVQELLGDERVAGVLLKDGETVPADLVIITAGIRSNSYLARLAGLRVNNGVIVDDFMRTSDAGVYAAGDIAEHRGVLYGLWNASQYQGSIAGMNAVGTNVEFGGIPRSNSVKVLGVDLLSIGKFRAEDGGDVVIEAEDETRYSRFIFRDSHLVGAILFGNTDISAGVKNAIESGEDFSGFLEGRPTVSDVWAYFLEEDES